MNDLKVNNLKEGVSLYHKHLGKCFVHNLQKFNRNPSTICVMPSNCKGGVKELPKDSFITPSNEAEKYSEYNITVNILSDYVSSIWYEDTEDNNVQEKLACLTQVSEYIQNTSMDFFTGDKHIIYIKVLKDVLEYCRITNCDILKEHLPKDKLLNALIYLELIV